MSARASASRSWGRRTSIRTWKSMVSPASAVGAVVVELVGVDLHAQARVGTHCELTVVDLERLREQVVAHVKEVGQLAGALRGQSEGRSEGDRAHRTELAVDLIAHDHLDAESLHEVVHAL